MRNLNLSFFVLLGLIVVSCGKRQQDGQVIGVQDRPKWNGINPYGMVYVPSGTYTMGQSDQDKFSTNVQKAKQVSISGFYMDETEITNNEYRQFTYWVKDSLAHATLGHFVESEDGNTDKIDWSQEIDWEDETLKDLNFQGADAFKGVTEIDSRKLIYSGNGKTGNWQPTEKMSNGAPLSIKKRPISTRIHFVGSEILPILIMNHLPVIISHTRLSMTIRW